jgi:hypothetical protein
MLGKRVTISRSSDSGTTWDEIADVIGISGTEETRETNDSTPHGGSDDARRHDYGLYDGGETELTTRHKASQAEIDALVAACRNGTKEDLRLTFPAPISKTVTGVGLITKIGTPTPVDNQVDRVVTIKWDGLLTEAAV